MQDFYPNLHNETFLSDISDSVCTEMVERNARNQDLIESPPAFLMNDNVGPPSVVYKRGITNSTSFPTVVTSSATVYSAAATEAGTVINHESSDADAQDTSKHLSVIDEGNETGIEVDFDQISFSLSRASCEIELKEGELNQEGVLVENISRPMVVAVDEVIKKKDDKNKDEASNTSKSSRSNRKRSKTIKVGSVSNFFKRGADDTSDKMVISRNIADSKPEEDIELSYLDKCVEQTEGEKAIVTSADEPNKRAVDIVDIDPEDSIELTLEHGFEVTNPLKSVDDPMCFVAVNTTGEPMTTKDTFNERVVCDADAGGMSVEVIECNDNINKVDRKAKNKTNEWGLKPLISLSLDYDDNNTVGSDALSFITMDTKDLTDISDNSTYLQLDRPASEQKSSASLVAKLFACGATAVRCGEYYENEHRHDSNSSRMSEEEKIEKLTRVYDESVKKRHSEDERACEDGSDPVENATKLEVKSNIVAKTKVYPGIEVSEKRDKSKVSTNSRSHAIKEMVKMLKKKEKSRAKNDGKSKRNDHGKSKKTILERVKVHVS